MAKKPIKITETVLRDAHQSLLATRMPLSDMLPILGIGLIVLASLIALIVAGRRRRAGKDDEN